MASAETIALHGAPSTVAPPSAAERAIISRVVDAAPPIRPTVVAEIAALFGGAR